MRRWHKRLAELTQYYGYWRFRAEHLRDTLEAHGAIDPSGCGVYAYVDADTDEQAD